MASRPRAKMPISERAKQFMPFAAVKGLTEALTKKEKVIVPKVVLSEEMAVDLNEKMVQLHKGTVATVTYFYDDEYLKITGVVVLFDKVNQILRILDTKIPFNAILDIEFPE